MSYKELFTTEYFDFSYRETVIFDTQESKIYHSILLFNQRGNTVTSSIYRKGNHISFEMVRDLAKKSDDERARAYLNITDDNWEKLIPADESEDTTTGEIFSR